MGIFGNITQASVSGGGIYFLDGNYIVRIDTVNAHKGFDHVSFIVEATVIASNNPNRPAGMKCSQVINMQQKSSLGNVKQFVGAANGIPISDIDRLNREVNEELVEFVAHPQIQPCRGMHLHLDCVSTPTRPKADGSRGVFTKHTWSPLTPDELATYGAKSAAA